ncbi:hypothetical protein PEAC54167_05790 [Pediococcus acidilactici]|uniref:hypothetical protein n=1 Tax=Pediococcus acidilactici TaxID=1254 RepID=UPI000E5D23A8|nr:hypothetical protein [Pediococcus acidilactici]KAF0366637.1 hypothetical protein GBO52_08530 [Pediococcus acidilactici]KAF0517592.1 hypothetical protein GBP29_03900 [Pediococcus acidilactici]MCT3036963.1 hypothetical protein [Pediococcus acidilactici]QQC46050.1 hypothetical protein I6H65_02120 [Pediococcus acidilactici]RJF46658.1 hypothetical protein DSN65_08875 [Pediococcus acidilactici]
MFNFSISWLIFWMKGRVEVDNQSVRSRIPRLLIWIFPYGMVAKDVNLADIKTTEVKSKNQIFPLLLGIVLIVLGILSTMNDGVALGILAIIIGIILGGAGFKARLVLTTTQGTVNLDAVAFQKDVLLQIAQEIKNRQTKPEPQIKDNQVLEEL